MFTLWWSYKIFFGLLSDTVPIRGQRRKPYLLIGWILAIACSLLLAVLGSFSGTVDVCYNADGGRTDCAGGEVVDGPYKSSDLSMNTIVFLMVANNFGYVLADVSMDSLAIEYAKREPPEKRGEIQGTCYSVRAMGFLVAYCITGFGFNSKTFKGDFDFGLSIPAFLWVLVFLQCVGLPWWIQLEDRVVAKDAQFESDANFGQMWKLLCNKTMAQLMLFTVIMNMSQVVLVNARQSVLNLWVGMDPLINSFDNDFQQFIQVVVLFSAGKWLKRYNWRMLLLVGTLLWTVWQLLFWLVVFDVCRENWLVIFIDLDQTFAANLGYLVVMWAVVEMAPKNMEGTTLALATTVGNAGQSLGGYILVAFNAMFSLSQKQIEQDAVSTRWQYCYNSIAVILVQWAYLLFVCWMPQGFSQAKLAYQKEAGKKSTGWGILAACLVIFAISWGTLSTFMAYLCPCNVIFGGHGCKPDFFSCADDN